MNKPRIFVGSSTEGLPIADAIFSHIQYETEPIMWKHGLFLPGKFSFEVLEEQLRDCSFAIMVASPDDILEKRGEKFDVMRDNILIEFGLFAGVLGRKRTFLVLPKNKSIDIPTDLLGIIPAQYDDERLQKYPNEHEACVQDTCRVILKAIKIELQQEEMKIAEEQAKVLKSEKAQAIQALYEVATKIRDVIVIIQTDLTEAFSNFEKYNKVKDKAVNAVNTIYEDFKEHALKVDIEKELLALVEISKSAVQELPYPNELSMGKDDWQRKAVNTGISAFQSLLRGGDPVNEIRNTAGNEVEARIESLRIKFNAWWQKYCPQIQNATTQFQDALFSKSISIALKKF